MKESREKIRKPHLLIQKPHETHIGKKSCTKLDLTASKNYKLLYMMER